MNAHLPGMKLKLLFYIPILENTTILKKAGNTKSLV